MPTPTQLLGRPSFRTTLFVALIGMAVMSLTIRGLPVSSWLYGCVFIFSITVSATLTVGLGAWAALRNRAFKERLPIPLLIMFSIALAEIAGQRISHARTLDPNCLVRVPAMFWTSFAIFSGFRIAGWWKIEAKHELPSSQLTLARLFGWVSVIGVMLAVLAAVLRGYEIRPDQSIATELMGGMVLGGLLSLLMIVSVGVVIGENPSVFAIALGVISVFVIGCMAVMWAYQFPAPYIPLVAWGTLVGTSIWLACAFRSLGYYNATDTGTTSPRAWLFQMRSAGGVCLATATLGCCLFCIGPRREAQFRAKWAEHGVYPVVHVGNHLKMVSFSKNTFPISRQAVDALKVASVDSISVRCAASVEEVGWLSEIESLQEISFSGRGTTGIGDQHLQQLATAKQLKKISFASGVGVTKSGLQALQKNLPHVELRAPGLLPPPPVTTAPAIIRYKFQ